MHGIRESRRDLSCSLLDDACGRFATGASTGALSVAGALSVEGMPVQTAPGATMLARCKFGWICRSEKAR
jgi:hypothetical protein